MILISQRPSYNLLRLLLLLSCGQLPRIIDLAPQPIGGEKPQGRGRNHSTGSRPYLVLALDDRSISEADHIHLIASPMLTVCVIAFGDCGVVSVHGGIRGGQDDVVNRWAKIDSQEISTALNSYQQLSGALRSYQQHRFRSFFPWVNHPAKSS